MVDQPETLWDGVFISQPSVGGGGHRPHHQHHHVHFHFSNTEAMLKLLRDKYLATHLLPTPQLKTPE